jgi:hypothetical protein
MVMYDVTPYTEDLLKQMRSVLELPEYTLLDMYLKAPKRRLEFNFEVYNDTLDIHGRITVRPMFESEFESLKDFITSKPPAGLNYLINEAIKYADKRMLDRQTVQIDADDFIDLAYGKPDFSYISDEPGTVNPRMNAGITTSGNINCGAIHGPLTCEVHFVYDVAKDMYTGIDKL